MTFSLASYGTIKIDSNISVTLSLIDSQDVSFHKKLEGFLGDPRVVVAISINPKMDVCS